ncbi:MAG: DUF6463 family protein [Pseudomonadota bacterium]
MGKRWIGRWVIAVALLHTLIGVIALLPVVRAMIGDGLWNSVGENPMRSVAAWFLLGGGFMFVSGFAIDACERINVDCPLRSSGWSLLIITLITIILMPVSGAWLLLPPAIALIRRGSSS